MRFFENKLPDYVPGTAVHIDAGRWSAQIQQLCESILQGMPATLEYCDGGLYVGSAGIAYMFYHLASNETFNDIKSTYLEHALMYSKVTETYVKNSWPRQDQASFLLGEAGVQAVSAMIYEAVGSSKDADKCTRRYADIAEMCLPIDFLRCGSDELFVGRAGYLCGVMNLQKSMKRQVVSEAKIQEICSVMVASGKRYVKNNPSIPLMYAYYSTEYLGAAHGLASILQMLLSFPAFLTSSPESAAVVKASVDFLLALQQDNSNFPPAMDEVRQHRTDTEQLVHWCHGAPGVVYALARAYLVWRDEKYLAACLRCGELTWTKGLLRKGPSICHGVAGSGYVFLLLYRLTGDQKHLHRALKFAEFLFSPEFQQARIPDSPYSLYEGWAGTVCFLSDLLQPQKATFPFFDVFLE